MIPPITIQSSMPAMFDMYTWSHEQNETILKQQWTG